MRLIALVAVVAALAVSAADIDPCKRQPFRGRCPSKNGAAPTRSQFVLRYYLRDGECVSYPYGHCARDDSEPRLFRYKEECEDACINGPGNLGSPKETKEQKAPIASVNASPSTTTETPITNTEVPASSTSAPRTECERRRAQSGGLVRGGFKPACTTDGSFEKMQCEPSGGQCFCVDERGIEMPNSRMHGRPDCHQILNASPMRTNECTRGSSIGPCSGSIERWFYDESQHKCFAFKYSGCGGNGNNYPNQEACMARCAPPPGTAAKCEKGEPLKTVAGIPINCEKRDCPTGYKCSVVQGSSVCCPETEKTFGALQSNTPADLCQMPKERGPCDRYELRFYYNPDARECKYFFYGGCDGNGNNFEKVEDCERRCNVTKPTRFTNGHVAQTLNPTQPAAGPVRITTTTERPTHVTETTQRPTTTHSTTPPPPPPTREPLQKVFPLRPVQVPDQQMLLEKINENERSNRCQHPRDAGTCRGQFVRWFFNTEIGNCEVFTYTGCAGNGNNFASREECLLTCSRDGTRKEQTDAAAPRESEMTEESAETEVPNVANVCLHDVDAGECNGVFERFAFDHESGECRKFTYGGCGGNGNNFAALPDCEKKCGGPKVAAITNTANVPPPTVNICDHPVDKGPCTGTFGRFAFDPLTGDCQQFTYGGCAGNGNNFASLSDCRRVCLKSKTASTTEAAPVLQCPPTPRCLEGCQLVREHHGCFICNCNRPHAPAPMPPATQCPSIDINACAEPCIVFKNRRGCQECVCPLPQPTFNGNSVTVNQAVPPALPTASAQPPAPRVAQPAPPAPRAPAPPAPAPVRQPEPARTFQPQPPAPVARPVHVEPPRFEPRPPAPPAPIRVESVRTQENIHKVPLPEFEKPTDAPRRQFAQFNEQAHRENFHQIQTNSQQIPIRIEEEVRAERPQNTQTAQRLQPLQPSVVPSQITEKCMQPVEPGPCKNYVDRFYFNFEDGQCHAFKYGGCAGNRNHFFTMKECEIHCARFGHNVRGVAGGVANVPSAPPVSNTVVVTTTVESTTTVAATTTIAAPSTTASPTTTASTTPIPVQPDAAGREPVPLAPVGIGRSMQGVNIDEIDNLEPTSHKVVKTAVPSSATQPPRNGATESAPTQTNNSQRHREETFNAVIVCAMPPDAGICRNYVPRWFFNAQTGQCEQFSFGNCGGNANNFMDRATCELRCVPMHRPINVLSQVPDRCALERDQGFGRGYNVKWYFNMKNLRCEQFVYEGQGGNENQFETLTDCESYCTPRGRTHYVSLATTRQTTIQTSPATVPTTTQSTHAPTQAPTQQPKEPSIEPAPPAISDYSNEELQGETLSGEDRNVLQEIPDRVKSFEDDSHEDVLGPEPPVPDNEATLAPNPPGFEPRPPAIHSAKTENVAAPQPIPNVAADLDDKPKQSYKTEPLPAVSAPTGNENLPIVGPSPPESVNYQTGQKAKAQGILNFGDINAIDTDKFDLPDDDEEDSPVAMPACPNGLQAHRYVDGRPVQCLPGRNQCPSDSVCYFNGVDYFCCPNVEDPYDKHVFGGYDGEESKHGYKAFGPLKIQRLRDDPIRDRKKRQTAFSMDDIVMPLRFDAEKPRQFAAASVVRSSNRRRKQPNKNHVIQALSASGMDIAVCVQELAKGDCSEAHLRYFYDRDSDSCRLFYYSGCKGNGNNFGSLDDCQKTCVLGMKQMQDVGASVEVHVPAGQCPRGKLPLGGAAPVLCGNNTDSIGCPVGYYCRQGPPDVCCPGQEIPTANLDALLGARGDVRFAPQNSEEVVVTTTTIATTKKSFLEVPEFVCPDASDPLFGKNGRPLMCGAGFDGVKMCPKGFYCAIDSVKGTRLCCPLLGVGSRIPNQKVSAPYFGRRPANPGEVIERGSLPVDQANYQELPPKQDAQSETSFSEDEQIAETSAQQTAPTGTSEEIEHQSQEDVAHSQGPSKESDDTEEEASEETESETEETKADFAKLRLKPENPHVQKQQQAAEASQQVHQAESDGVSIDTNPELSVEETTTLKQTNDRSICQLTPSEGRACREDEVPPRTNLHYFFSTKDNRCKLYFYRGCGGNANRFEKKAQCEAMCLNRS